MKTINNLPDYAKDMKFIVVREYNGEYWFWGGYDDDEDKACKAAEEIGGIVIHTAKA